MVATIDYQKIVLLVLVILPSLAFFSGYGISKDLCQISIIVKDSITFDPIPGAKIFIGPSGTYIGYTNESGIISFKAEATHEYTFVIEKAGYYTETTAIKCWPNDSKVAYVYLKPVSETQEEYYYYYYEYQTQTTQISNQDFYAYFAQNYIQIPVNDEKVIDLYVCSNNDFSGLVSLTAVYSNGIEVDAPFLINLPKNSCVVEKVRIHSGDSYGCHYLYFRVKQRDNIVFSNKLTIYVPQKEENGIEKSLIPILNVTEDVIEKGEPLLVEAKIIAKGMPENTYITAKIRVDEKIIKREYFNVDGDSTITFNEIVNTNYFEEGYHYIILEVSTRDIINSTSKLVKFVVYENEVYANSEETASNDYHCLEIVDLRNYKVRMNETNKINFILYNCGNITENNIKIMTLFDGRTLINTVDKIEPNEYRAVTIHIAVHKPFDEYTARIHIYNQNVSIDAGFKLIGVVPDVKLVVKDAYTA
ncbi:MAG: hypothetical protein J7K83_02965, partial [Candidatus Aenigmarchaeota archaeon]|nr:hypothetical protein [Candidatus Aenigmarchaeota archaeon]